MVVGTSGVESGPGPAFARRLKELRIAAGMTQVELARAAGLHRFGVAKLEQGDREPSWVTVVKLAEALGQPLAAFLPSGHPVASLGVVEREAEVIRPSRRRGPRPLPDEG